MILWYFQFSYRNTTVLHLGDNIEILLNPSIIKVYQPRNKVLFMWGRRQTIYIHPCILLISFLFENSVSPLKSCFMCVVKQKHFSVNRCDCTMTIIICEWFEQFCKAFWILKPPWNDLQWN